MSPEPGATPELGTSAAVKRPVWVWVITIFFVVQVGVMIRSFVLILSGAVGITPAAQAYIAGLGPLSYIMMAGLGLLNLTAAVLLFLLKRAAVPLFATSFVLNVGFTLVNAVATNWAQAVGGVGLAGALFGWFTLGAVALYSWHLWQAGVLR